MGFKMKGPSLYRDKSAFKANKKKVSPDFDKNFTSLSKSKSPVFRKSLDEGVLGEANNDGSIFVDKSVPKGSPLEAEVVAHEQKHIDDMKTKIKVPGKKNKVKMLDYGDNFVIYKGKRLKREDGMIEHPSNGKMKPEGDKSFPWEQAAYKEGNKARKEAEKKI